MCRAPGAAQVPFRDLAALLGAFEALPAERAKRMLVIANRAGGFVKEFPAGPGIASPNWQYFIPAVGCPANCRYCFLQAYHPAGAPVIFTRQEDMLHEIEARAREAAGGYFYGGELCDNLMLEDYLQLAGPLVAMFRRLPGSTLELRTKSDCIEALTAAGAIPNVVISFTLTPEEAARRMEEGTAPVAARIDAARRLQRAGFTVGLRLDPIVLTCGWQGSYERLMDRVSRELAASQIESVHLGCMRYPPALKSKAMLHEQPSLPFVGEFVSSGDGKFRYPRPLRLAAYARIAGLVRAWDTRIPVRLVMEPERMSADLRRLLAQ